MLSSALLSKPPTELHHPAGHAEDWVLAPNPREMFRHVLLIMVRSSRFRFFRSRRCVFADAALSTLNGFDTGDTFGRGGPGNRFELGEGAATFTAAVGGGVDGARVAFVFDFAEGSGADPEVLVGDAVVVFCRDVDAEMGEACRDFASPGGGFSVIWGGDGGGVGRK